MLLLLESEFMALIFIVIYIGAIAVLFLFVIMMLNVKSINSTKDIAKYFPISNFIGLFVLIVISSCIFKTFPENSYNHSFLANFYLNWIDKIDAFVDIHLVGQVMYTHYILQFLVAGFVLLIAIIGASALTLNFKPNVSSKMQQTFKQVSR
jgi:NADH-quinone oxidoreductase subunit J